MLQRTMTHITGSDEHFRTEADVEFNHIKPFNPNLAAAKPDSCDGVHISKVHKKVRDQLGPLIIPSTNSTYPIAPNFFLEAKATRADLMWPRNRRATTEL